MKPRIFISAVTSELGTTRQLVANVVLRLGYDPVTQDIFGTESGDLRQVLRDKIDDCDGLIQLVGRGYGAEPPTVETEFGRVSYTQFEFLYARARGKKTWLIYAKDGCTRDHPLEELDRPRDPTHPTPAGYQSERRALQEAWRLRLDKEGHLRHGASSDTELELKVERLKDEFAELRREFRSWQQNVTRNLMIVALLLVAIGGGVWWTVFRQPGEVQNVVRDTVVTTIRDQTPQLAKAISEQLAAVKPDEIKEQLRKTIEATYQQELQEAEKLTEWQERDEAKHDAATSRKEHLDEVDKFLTSITSTIKSGDASPEFLELTRIHQEEGGDQALAYIMSQESRLLDEAEQLSLKKRRKLAPLLQGVRLHRLKGELAQARMLCDKLLKQDGDWLDVLHEHFATMIELGDRCQKYEKVEVALAHFEAAEVSAKRLVQADANSPIWQRDLSVSFDRLGDVFLKLGRTADALTQFEADLKIRRVLAEADPHDAQKQRDLFISISKLGDICLALGKTNEAVSHFEDVLQRNRVLAEADPRDAQKQRDLMISHSRIGAVRVQLGEYAAAIEQFQKGLAVLNGLIEKKLVVESIANDKAYLERRVQFCQVAVIATGDWDTLLKSDAKLLPARLSLRATELAKRGQLTEVAQAGAKLRELDSKSNGDLYNAACAYGLCAMLVVKDKPAPTQAERKKYLDLSLTCLKEALAAGYDDFDQMRQDTDLKPLHGVPEFEALFPKQKPE